MQKQFRTTQPPANSTQADSEAILPNRIQLVFLRAMFHTKQSKIHCNCSTGTVTRYLLIALGKRGGAVLFAPPRKAVAFLTTPSVCQKHGTGNFAACGQRSGLLALNLASIFEKLLDQKTFQLPAARIFEQSVFIKAIVSHETLHKKLHLLQ